MERVEEGNKCKEEFEKESGIWTKVMGEGRIEDNEKERKA